MSAPDKYEVYKFILSEIANQTGQQLNEFGMLKRMKLLFLFCTLSGNQRSFYYTDVFNNFHALPKGPVEITIYEMAKLDINPNHVGFVKESLKQDIINQITNLSQKYKTLFRKPGIDLVEDTHYFLSWQIAYNNALFKGKKSEKIDLKLLIDESLAI